MLTLIAIAALALAVAVLIFAAGKPDTFRIERSTSIKAAPDQVFALINDLHHWDRWSPYEKLDPTMQRVHSGATQGTGAIYTWDGNKKIGAGRMEILQSAAPLRVMIKLDFSRPFTAHNIAEFSLQTQGNGTHVTWAMYGPSPYLSKLMGVFFNMENTVGLQFAEGLANLKSVAEQA